MMTNQNQLPVLFIGHGSPMNAIEENEFSLGWREISKKFPKPRLILCISAHWVTEGTKVTAMENPKTIHDFYGFPDELFRMNYPAQGSPKDAEFIKKTIQSVPVELDQSWGLDHGTWSVLVKMYTDADIPVIQLSLDNNLSPQDHFQIGQELKPLREDGVLILGSGNIVHNLRMLNFQSNDPYPWATEFDALISQDIMNKNYQGLIDYSQYSASAIAVPTNEHYLPLLYAAGASDDQTPEFFNIGYYAGSIGMRSLIYR